MLARGVAPGSPEFNRVCGQAYERGKLASGRLKGQELGPPVPGDWLTVKQANGKYHQGVCVEEGRVLHATVSHGVIVTSLASFSQGQVARVVRRCSSDAERERVVKNAMAMEGASYNVLSRNCEQVASEAHLGEGESMQIEAAVLLFLLIGSVGLSAL